MVNKLRHYINEQETAPVSGTSKVIMRCNQAVHPTVASLGSLLLASVKFLRTLDLRQFN